MLTEIRIESTHAILHAYDGIDRSKKFAKNSIRYAEMERMRDKKEFSISEAHCGSLAGTQL